MHPSIAVDCNDIPLAKVSIVQRTQNYRIALCLGVSVDGSWRVRKRHTVHLIIQEVLILIPTTTYRSEAF